MSTTPASGGPSSGRASVPGALAPTSGARARVSGANAPTSPAAAGVYGRPARSSDGPPPPKPPTRTPGNGGQYSGRKKIRPRWGRIALVAGVGVLVLALLAGLGGYLYYRNVDAGLNRDDPFSQITGGRPPKVADGALNILLLGSDSRDPDNGGKAGEWRTDTMIVMHIPADHQKAYLVSMPRDLYVHIPKSRTTQYGNTNAKLNASFSWGGTPLTVQTIEEYTNVRMDHVLLIDFGGFKQVIDALGGIDMNIEKDITSIHPPKRQFKKGMNHLNGDEALDYARQRYQFVDGDFARMRHQQEMMKAILDKAVSGGTVSNPSKLNSFLKAVTKSMTVDKDFSLADMALQFRNLRSDDLTFMVSPNDGSKKINGEDVVVPDKEKATALYDAVRNDKMTDWMTANGPKPSTAPSTKTK
jgi:LCP family protein required for cell wall assembly